MPTSDMIGSEFPARRARSEIAATTRRKRLGSLASFAGVVVLVLWVGFDLFGRIAKGDGPWFDTLVDYRIIYDSCRDVLSTGHYPRAFPYPPPSTFLFSPLVSTPFPFSAACWLVLLGLSAVTCWLTLASLLRLDWKRGDYLLLPLAHVTCTYFFQWDLRSANCNLFVLQLLLLSVRSLHRQSEWAAGFWLALSISLKLYSLPVVAYYLWVGRGWAVASTLAWLVVLWVVVPVAAFGPSWTVRAYESWAVNLKAATRGADDAFHPILTSLERAGTVLGGEPGHFWLPLGGKVVWAAIFLVGWRLSARRSRERNDAYGLLADVSIFAIVPVAISPYLEPYHAVPFAIPAALLVTAGMDSRQSFRLRLFTWLAFAATWAVMKLPIDFYAKGLLINIKLAIGVAAVVGIAAVRRPLHATLAEPAPVNRPGRSFGLNPFSRLTGWRFAAKSTA